MEEQELLIKYFSYDPIYEESKFLDSEVISSKDLGDKILANISNTQAFQYYAIATDEDYRKYVISEVF